MFKTTLFQTTPRVLMGVGALNQAAAEVGRFHVRKILLITDPGLVAAGIAGRLEEILIQAGLSFSRFDKVEPDPAVETALQAAEAARGTGADFIIGLGGGSVLDVAKVAAVLATQSIPIEKMFGLDQVPGEGLNTLLIPTTAGTGSEVTPIAILSDHGDKLKKGIVSPRLLPKTAILDAELTVGLPPAVTAATGMDALIHAMEAYTSRNASPLSDLLAEQAMRRIYANLRKAFADGEDLTARAQMLEGSFLAGLAFANAGVTAVHAFAYPIGAEFHIPHGIANSIMLPAVLEFNLLGNLVKFSCIAKIFGEQLAGLSIRERAKRTLIAVQELLEDLQVPRRLSTFGVTEKDIAPLAAGVMKVTRLLANNPRKISLADAESIYRKVL